MLTSVDDVASQKLLRRFTPVKSLFLQITKSATKAPTTLQHGGVRIKSNQEKADVLNKFFSEVGQDRAEDVFDEKHTAEIEKRLQNFDYGEGPQQDKPENERITEGEILEEVRKLNPRKATGVDEIHARFLMHGGPIITTTLAILYNESWSRGDLFQLWRTAEISPIPKSPSQYCVRL